MSKAQLRKTKPARLELANRIITIISEHGRRFYSTHAENRNLDQPKVVSRFELAGNGKLWLVDKYTKRRVYVAYEGRWRGFSEGGTLRSIVAHLRDWIVFSDPIPPALWGVCKDGAIRETHWGYDEEMEPCRNRILAEIAGSEGPPSC